MKLIIAWSIFVLLMKTIRDISLYRWEWSWMSKISFLCKWRDLKGPFNLFHIIDGAIFTSAAGVMIYFWCVDHLEDPWGFLQVTYYVIILFAWWVIFYPAFFNLMYHVLFMRFKYWFK